MTRFTFSLVLATALTLASGPGNRVSAADAPSQGEQYPADAVNALYDGCTRAKDLPADKVKPVCNCYAVMVQATVPYSVFAKTNAELKAKGFDGLDAEGKTAMEKNRYDGEYCRLKHEAAGTAEERATFPESALPALHASCMNFEDVAADRKARFCTCYESLVRTKITYSDWMLLSLAIQTKGVSRLDRDEARTFVIVRSARLGCGGPPAK